MSKRKAGVNDIIYELDNDDVEISSEDEVKEAKINRIEVQETANHVRNKTVSEGSCVEVINLDSTVEDDCSEASPNKTNNGGKTTTAHVGLEDKVVQNDDYQSPKTTETVNVNLKPGTDNKTTILNEDIVVDSPANSDLGVVGCENRTPLVTIKFRDKKMAKNYKAQVKKFMLDLIRLHDEEGLTDSETDLELDIWPEDVEEPEKEAVEDSFFFVDTEPGFETNDEIPRYRQVIY